MKFISSLKDQAIYLVILSFGLFYFYSLPHFMQGGDTAELVSAAKSLYVPHPPGYPLWIWLEWMWLHVASIGTLFWQASLLNSFYALATLFLVLLPLKEKPLLLVLAAASLGLSTAFLESALLPDVFSLHALIVSLIGSLYLFKEDSSKSRIFLIPFLFFTGLAHHHTIVFLFPLVFQLFVEGLENKKNLKLFFSGVITGILFLGLLYSSLYLMHPMSYFSWGTISSSKDILAHFLRIDYGTFSLAPTESVGLSKFDSLAFFFKTTVYELGSLLILSLVVAFPYFKSLKNAKFIAWIFTVLLSLTFFYMTNFKMEGIGLEIIKRFHIMPAILIVLTSVYLLKKSQMLSKELTLLAIVSVIGIIPQCLQSISSVASLKNDSVFEDYSNNLLEMAKANEAKLILVNNDHAYFGLRYVQSTNEAYDRLTVISPSLLFHKWYFGKIRLHQPDFQLLNSSGVWANKTMNLTEDVIVPNLSLILIGTQKLKINQEFQITNLPLGFLFSTGSGEKMDDKKTSLRLHPLPENFGDSPQGFSKKLIYGEYSLFYLSKGMEFYKKGNIPMAQSSWREALKIVPYCTPALTNLCMIDKKNSDCSQENLERMKNESQLIF